MISEEMTDLGTFTIQRLATADEIAAEMDRRGAVIEQLETNLRHWREECGKLHAKIAILQADLTSWETTAKLVEQDDQASLCDILQAHEMEKKVLYEALERALSHFAVMGTDQAKRAAEEIEDVLTPSLSDC
jgi:hypothetical protein